VTSFRSGAAPPAWGERGPRRDAAMERREAPHPYVTGVRAPPQRRAADPRKVRQGASQAPGASRRSISLAPRGRRKKGKGRRPASEIEVPGRRSVGCLTSEYEL
jgi:hypothetical protein